MKKNIHSCRNIKIKNSFVFYFGFFLLIISFFYRQSAIENIINVNNVYSDNIEVAIEGTEENGLYESNNLSEYNQERIFSLWENVVSLFSSDENKGGKVIYVPGDFFSIQEAIDNGSFGDTVLVSSGEYRENIAMKNGISLVGESYENTIIDGQGFGNVVSFKNIDNVDTRLENFSIKNSGEGLSGVLIEDSSPLLNRNYIIDNDYNVYIKGKSSPLIQRNRLSGAKSGIQVFNLEYVDYYKPIIIDNIIYKNKKGINVYNGEVSIEHNTISFNSYYKDDLGATFGIYFSFSKGEIVNNIITDNGNCELCSGIYFDEDSKSDGIRYNNLWNNKNNFICFGDCGVENNNFSADVDFESEETLIISEDSYFINAASDGQNLGARL